MILIQNNNKVDIAGIGIGPSNLSLAALLQHKVGYKSAVFFDASEKIQWHPGMMYPESLLQVSFLKDLVTLVDPSNPFSFLCFLADENRLYRFLNARYTSVKRKEFESYFQWIAKQLPHLLFDQKVNSIDFNGKSFDINTTSRHFQAHDIVLGTGLTPKTPVCTHPYLCDTVFHVKDYLKCPISTKDKRIAIIGGGQSGAEIFSHLLGKSDELPENVYWVSSRANFSPIDDSPFTNEYFTPGFSNHFYQLSYAEREKLVAEQTLASDGISEYLLQRIYQQLYELKFIEKKPNVGALLQESVLNNMKPNDRGWQLTVENKCGIVPLNVDIVILATGFQYQTPEFLDPIKERIDFTDGKYNVNADYSITWDGPSDNRIYVQNAARLERGVADPNLSLMAWRSAMIINSLTGKNIYKTSDEDRFMSFQLPAEELAYS